MEEIIKICRKVSEKKAVSFRLKSKEIDVTQLFSEEGLLPSIMKRADQLSLLLFGERTGAQFKESEKSMSGVQVDVSACKSMASYLTVVDVVMELIKKGKDGIVEVDELLYD